MTDKFNWKAKREKKAFLALADGAVFHGYAFGEATDTVGEAVFNTGMAGYKQIPIPSAKRCSTPAWRATSRF